MVHAGLTDSLAVLQIVSHLEQTYGVDFTETGVVPEELSTIAGTAVNPLDNINTKVTSVQLSAKYALQRNTGVRVVYIFDRYRSDDWTWANWNYSPADGGTTVLQEPDQKVHFIGATYYYRWQ